MLVCWNGKIGALSIPGRSNCRRAEVAINVDSVLVQEFQALGVAGLLEINQELAQSVIQIPDVTRGDEIRKV